MIARRNRRNLENLAGTPKATRWTIVEIITLLIYYCGAFGVFQSKLMPYEPCPAKIDTPGLPPQQNLVMMQSFKF